MTTPRKSSRRAFLQGKSVARAVADAAQTALPPGSAEANQVPAIGPCATVEAEQERYLIRVGRRAMACEFEVLLNAGQYADGTEWAVCSTRSRRPA